MESDKQSQAIASLLSMALGYIKPMTLKCALDLGIPEEISKYGEPMTLTQLQSALSLPESKKTHLRHLLRILTHFGFIHVQAGETEDAEATYDLTPTSRLVSNKKGSLNLSLFVQCQLEAGINLLLKAFVCMGDWFKQDDKEMPFELAYGCGLWEMASKNPQLNDMFNEAMVSYCSTFDDAIIKNGAEIFKGVESLVDVAGGTGGVTKAIAANFPHVQCTVLDLPHVVQDVPNEGNVKFVAGDMFKYIPPADAVLLKSTLHCFGDEDCVKILKRCKEAIGSRGTGGKVILMESVVGTSHATTVEEAKLLFDLLMLNNHAGAERDEHEWNAIFKRAGFSSYKIVVTVGSISVMEVYP